MTKHYEKEIDSHIHSLDGGESKAPPTLESIFNARGLNKASSNHPKTSSGSFQFFCWLLEGPKLRDKPEQREIINKVKGNKTVWIWPYAVQFIANCFKFLDMEREDQHYIVAAREDGVSWRGDDIDFFRTVYANTMDWRGLSDVKGDLSKKEVMDKVMQAASKTVRHKK